MIFLDWMNTVLQSSMFSYFLSYCIDKRQEINKIKLCCMIVMFTLIGVAFTRTFTDSPGLAVFLSHIFALGLVIMIYRKDLVNGLIAYTIIYSIIGIHSIIFGNVIFAYIGEILPADYLKYAEIFVIYITQTITILLCFRYIEKVKQVYRIILNRGLFVYELIFSFAIDFVITFYLLTFANKSQAVKNLVYVMFFIFFAVTLFYFWRISSKSERILKLNESLEIKNDELSKIKHDYGAQISYLYGLCLLERYSDLKKALKDIINVNETTHTAAEVIQGTNSLLSLALKPAIDAGIHVILEDTCDYSLVEIEEIELYRVVSNIVSNAIIAMKGKGIIIVKSYESLENIIIEIENNGPKIAEEKLKNIFKAGFTTKENSDKSHGYGLSIVKEIVEKYNGKICVKSSDTSTKFKINFPIK